MRAALAVTVMVIGVSAAAPAMADPVRLLPFELLGHAAIVVPVTIDGEGPFRFLLDTGSSRTAVADDLAARLGLRVVGHTSMHTVVGRTRRPLAPLLRVALGDGPPGTVLAMILPAARLDRGLGLRGIIGRDILARRPYTIDYERRHVAWHLGPGPDGIDGSQLRLERRDEGLVVELPQASRATTRPARTLRLVPDSGATELVLFDKFGRAMAAHSLWGKAVLASQGGSRTVPGVFLDELQVGEVWLKNQPAALIEADEPLAGLGDGLLPLHLFSRVTFDLPRGVLIVEGR